MKFVELVHYTCVIHPDCCVYWWPDPKRNRLRGRQTHVRSWDLYDGTLWAIPRSELRRKNHEPEKRPSSSI